MELEAKVRQLEQELQSAPSARRGASIADWIPRNPARHVLTGHRQPLTDVAFHPQFSQLATASEDATVKIYDWETGELEQTLKGHTKPVQSIAFDFGGQYLGRWTTRTLTASVVCVRLEHQALGRLSGVEKRAYAART